VSPDFTRCLALSFLNFFRMHPVLFQFGHFILPSYSACAALGVLLALWLAHWTAKCAFQSIAVDPATAPRHAWNMLALAIFASLAVSRLVLVVVNFSDLRQHPSWISAMAMVHHPLLAAVGAAGGAVAVLVYARWTKLPLRIMADALAAPLLLWVAAENLGEFFAGSGYGRESMSRSFFAAVTYTDPIAAHWSGTPLGVPLYPVQAYAAVGALVVAAIACAWFLLSRRSGEVGGVSAIGFGILLFTTECFRDWEGRGELFSGAVDIPQLVGLGWVICGGLLLLDWKRPYGIPESAIPEKVHDA
jgi:phosphatidylglycerol---prolipoprotein diacylglyceryl transferase